MLCCDCPYGYKDFMRLSKIYNDDFSREDIERSIWCDKVGGRIGVMGYCSEYIDDKDNVVINITDRPKRNKYERRNLKYKNKMKHLYKVSECHYPPAVLYINERRVKRFHWVKREKPYYKRIYRGKHSQYLKQQSNRKIRRYKGELHNGNMAHKLFDFWWELC